MHTPQALRSETAAGRSADLDGSALDACSAGGVSRSLSEALRMDAAGRWYAVCAVLGWSRLTWRSIALPWLEPAIYDRFERASAERADDSKLGGAWGVEGRRRPDSPGHRRTKRDQPLTA